MLWQPFMVEALWTSFLYPLLLPQTWCKACDLLQRLPAFWERRSPTSKGISKLRVQILMRATGGKGSVLWYCVRMKQCPHGRKAAAATLQQLPIFRMAALIHCRAWPRQQTMLHLLEPFAIDSAALEHGPPGRSAPLALKQHAAPQVCNNAHAQLCSQPAGTEHVKSLWSRVDFVLLFYVMPL